MKPSAFLASCAAALALSFSLPAWSTPVATVLSVDAPATGTVNDLYVVKINIQYDDPTVPVFLVDFGLEFDPFLMEYQGGVEGSSFLGWSVVPFVDSGTGRVSGSLADFVTFSGVIGPVNETLVELTFRLLGGGTSALNLDVLLIDDFLDPITPDAVESASVSIAAAQNQAPAPASLLLVGLGLVLLGWTRRNASAHSAG